MKRSRFDDVLLGLTALLTALVAALGAGGLAPASHDTAVVQAVGLGWTGVFHGLDVLVGAPAVIVPIGTRALRAALASAVVAGAAAGVGFLIARELLGAVVPALFSRLPRLPRLPGLSGGDAPEGATSRLLSLVAALVVLAATLGPAWQAEASAPGGAVTGALLVLAALALGQRVYYAPFAPLALVLGLAASEEPLVLASAALASAPWLERALRRKIDRREAIDAAIAFGLGLTPLLLSLALARRPAETAILPIREKAGASVLPFVRAEVGAILLYAAGAGAALTALVAWLSPKASPAPTNPGAPTVGRRFASLVFVLAGGALAISLGAPASTSRVASPVLAAIACVLVLSGVALASAAIAIARARVPFAQASATLVVVLELVLPVRAADETFGRREARAPRATSTWDEVAWGSAPPAAVVLVTDRGTFRRIAAARATGAMRGDLLVVPAFDLDAQQARRALAAEPKLAPLYRDVALGSPPEELSLAALASERPLVAAFDGHWDRALARHLVPSGLSSIFESEPRGVSDRKKALDAFTAAKERLVRVALPKRDPDLASATATLLRARAIGMAACGERDVLSRALDDLRPFAPDDPVASTLVRRIVTSKGPIEVKDLSP